MREALFRVSRFYRFALLTLRQLPSALFAHTHDIPKIDSARLWHYNAVG